MFKQKQKNFCVFFKPIAFGLSPLAKGIWTFGEPYLERPLKGWACCLNIFLREGLLSLAWEYKGEEDIKK